jgi:hypothetical protein
LYFIKYNFVSLRKNIIDMKQLFSAFYRKLEETDIWKYHPKHVEQFPDINKLCNVASCWIYNGILLGAHPILHISRIRVKHHCKGRLLQRHLEAV